MVAFMEIAGRKVGPGCPTFIIAEAGVNHNGNAELAARLVDAALEAGADAVKFQTWVTEKLVVPEAPMAEYQRRNLGSQQSQAEMLKRLELSHNQFREIMSYADRRGILFFSTPDEEWSADFLDELGIQVFKIGSGEVTNLPFLKHVASKGKPIILSTGMSGLGEVEAAVRTMEETGNTQLALLHCVSSYPAQPSECNLRVMDTLALAFGYPVGFSDHTLGSTVAIASVARGACVVEKHLTLDTRMEGPDHLLSLNPQQFRSMVAAIRDVEKALGDAAKRPTSSETETRKVVRKSIVAARAIRSGKILECGDLALRRASAGLPPAYLPLLVGRQATDSIPADSVITLDRLR